MRARDGDLHGADEQRMKLNYHPTAGLLSRALVMRGLTNTAFAMGATRASGASSQDTTVGVTIIGSQRRC